MKTTERKAIVLAMEELARCINDESIFDRWLMVGVADGDVPPVTNDKDKLPTIDDIDESYVDNNEDFAELMKVFLDIMSSAAKSGGLYCDGVVSR